MAFAAILSLIKGCHGKVVFFFYFPGIFGKWLRVTTQAGKFLPQMKFMLKDHSPHRFYKNYGTTSVFLGPNCNATACQYQQERKKENYFT